MYFPATQANLAAPVTARRSGLLDRGGFTLIELLVVILVVGILLAIALPAFLGQQDKAKDSDSKQKLSTAYKVAKAEAVDHGDSFVTDNFDANDLATKISQAEPELEGVEVIADPETPVINEGKVYLVDGATAGKSLMLASKSASGKVHRLTVVDFGAPDFASIDDDAGPDPSDGGDDGVAEDCTATETQGCIITVTGNTCSVGQEGCQLVVTGKPAGHDYYLYPSGEHFVGNGNESTLDVDGHFEIKVSYACTGAEVIHANLWQGFSGGPPISEEVTITCQA